MELTLTVTEGPTSRDVLLSLDATSLEEFATALDAAGVESMARLSAGEWDARAGAAILWAKLRRQGVDCTFEDFTVDYGRFIDSRDADLEAGLPMEGV